MSLGLVASPQLTRPPQPMGSPQLMEPPELKAALQPMGPSRVRGSPARKSAGASAPPQFGAATHRITATNKVYGDHSGAAAQEAVEVHGTAAPRKSPRPTAPPGRRTPRGAMDHRKPPQRLGETSHPTRPWRLFVMRRSGVVRCRRLSPADPVECGGAPSTTRDAPERRPPCHFRRLSARATAPRRHTATPAQPSLSDCLQRSDLRSWRAQVVPARPGSCRRYSSRSLLAAPGSDLRQWRRQQIPV